MKELASRDPREMYRNSKIDIHARKLDRANRDYQFTKDQKEHIVEAFNEAYDSQVAKFKDQQKKEKENERKNE